MTDTNVVSKREVLKFKDRVRCFNWLKENDARLCGERVSIEEALLMMKLDLGLEINRNNFQSLRNEAEIEWSPVKKNTQILELEKDIDELLQMLTEFGVSNPKVDELKAKYKEGETSDNA